MKFPIISLISFSLCGAAVINPNWWDHTSIYDINVWSFQDSNNDGVGDINGLISQLDYLKDLGVPVIKLSQIFSSPESIINSYAVDNFYEIHSALGTLSDFDTLIAKAHYKGIKVILDINLNHCHESHEWFQKSIKGASRYRNYFVWRDGRSYSYIGIIKPPNSLRNAEGKSSWKWNSQRKQFFYSYHNHFSPDFDLENKDVVNEIFKILSFWFDRGVSGFNLLGTENYFESSLSNGHKNKNVAPNYDGLFNFVERLRTDLDNHYSYKNNKILMASLPKTDRKTSSIYMGSNDLSTFHIITVDTLAEFSLQDIGVTNFFNQHIRYFANLMTKKRQIEWLLEDENHSRMANNNNKTGAEVMLTIQACLPGIMRMYYGSELGMSEYSAQPKQCLDNKWKYTNTKALPMQWNGLAHAGFSTNNCLLQKPNPNYVSINVENEKLDPHSTYNLVKNLLELRENNILKSGSIEFGQISNFAFYFKRSRMNSNIYCVINFNNVPEKIDLRRINSIGTWKVLLTTPYSSYEKGDQIKSRTIVMRPISSIILTILEE